MTSPRHVALTLIMPACVAAGMVAPFVVSWSRLPDPIATHWSPAPDGAMPKLAAVALPLGLWIGVAVMAWLQARRTAAAPSAATSLVVAAVLLYVSFSIVWANLDAPHWTAARHLSTLPTILGVVALASVGGLLGRALDRKTGVRRPTGTPRRVELGPNERAVWAGRSSNLWLLGVGFVIPAWLLVGQRPPAYQLVIAVCVAFGLIFSTVHVLVSDRGVRIELGPIHWPSKFIPLSEITRVEVRDVQPLRYGGWGYRMPGRGERAFVVRGGEGLAVTTRKQRTWVVTVSDAETGAGLLQSLLDRRPPSAPIAGS